MDNYNHKEIESRWSLAKARDKQGYDHKSIENKWQNLWHQSKIYESDLDRASRPFYNLMMFPYPSAEGLHVGNMYSFTGSDIYGRFKRMQGYDVFEPIGLDGFGIHSENYALKIDKHPKELAKITQANFYRQLAATGNGYAWSHKLETYDTNYYKWTQWIFVKMFKNGLAYRTKSKVNWCPSCKTVLADEQVVNKLKVKSEKLKVEKEQQVSVCERCQTEVEIKELEQWFFKITDYADKLLSGLSRIDWSEKVKIAQRLWLGKSEGADIKFTSDIEKDTNVIVFTTRPDTIYGATFIVLAPEHPLVIKILDQAKGTMRQEIQEYVDHSIKKSEFERVSQKTGEDKLVKTGVFTGFHCTNPFTKKKIPIYIADYVLMAYGTGAIMGVPAHDERDLHFARKYNLDIVNVVAPGPVIKSSKFKVQSSKFDSAYEGDGVLVNSGKFSGMASKEAINSIIKYIESIQIGSAKVTWHLRDWIISRQRYWGAPIPMIYCENCASEGKGWFNSNKNYESRIKYHGQENSKIHNSKYIIQNAADWNSAGWYPVPEKDLPVELPYIENFKPTGTGVSPLAQDQEFVRVACPECGREAKRETDVSDTFLDSAWYFLRYPSVNAGRANKNLKLKIENLKLPWNPEITKKWLPVDMYIGGAEHSVLHLLYSRFLTMALKDMGYVDFNEPFTKFRAHGLLISKGAKMSKSKGNVVNPDDYIEKYGADTLRCYLMFCGRFSQGGDFTDAGIAGMRRFLMRVWRLVINAGPVNSFLPASAQSSESSKPSQPSEPDDLRAVGNLSTAATRFEVEDLYMMHKTIKKVTEDIQDLSYNTAISAIMEWVNYLESKIAGPADKNLKLKIENLKFNSATPRESRVTLEEMETLLLLLAPFAVHMTEELWQKLQSLKTKDERRKLDSIHVHTWPKYDPKLAISGKFTLIVQVNGKVRAKIETEKGIDKDQAEKLALNLEKIKRYLGDKGYKVIFVTDRLINFVTK